MNEAEYLHWLIADTVKQHPDLTWFLGCVADSLSELTIEEVHHYFANDCTDWEVLKYCAYQSAPLNIEHTTMFVDAVFRQLSHNALSDHPFTT